MKEKFTLIEAIEIWAREERESIEKERIPKEVICGFDPDLMGGNLVTAIRAVLKSRPVAAVLLLITLPVMVMAFGMTVGHIITKRTLPHIAKPAGPPPAIVEPRLEFMEARELTLAESEIDTRHVQRLVAHFLDPSAGALKGTAVELYTATKPPLDAGLIQLAKLDCIGARPFSVPAQVKDLRNYQFMLEAIQFDTRPAARMVRFFAQPDLRQLERRESPWPIWIESPSFGQVLESPLPFYVKGQAYEDGFLQLRTRPKLQGRYYLKGLKKPVGKEFAVRVKTGQPFGDLPVQEGGSEGFELYALFAKEKEYLPRSEAIDALPHGTGRVEIIGPIDFFLSPPVGHARTIQELEHELGLIQTVQARLTSPDQDAKQTPHVSLRYFCSGQVSSESDKLNYRYVLGVRPIYPVKPDPDQPMRYIKTVKGGPGHNVWLQSSPWQMENGTFEGKLVKFGVEKEAFPYWEFELWLIAVEPEVTIQLEEGQAWLASALPEGCVRVASVTVVKVAEENQNVP